MHRMLASLLIFAGVFLIAFAAIVKFMVAPASVKAPLSIPAKYTVVLASGSSFNYYDSAQNANVPINVAITRVIVGDVAAGTSKVAVYDESLCLTRDTDGSAPGCVPKGDPRLITNSTDRVAFDRKSGLAVSGAQYGANVNGDVTITHVGLDYKFPIDTAKKTYPFFDTVVGKAFPMVYIDTEKVAGLRVYKFVQTITSQDVYTNNTFPSTYDNTRTVWVEPTTGVIVKGQEQLKQVLTGRADLTASSAVVEPKLAGVVALQGTLAFTPATVQLQAQLAKDNLPKIHLVRLWMPLLTLVLGLIALGVALWLGRRGAAGGAGGFGGERVERIPPSPHPESVGPRGPLERV